MKKSLARVVTGPAGSGKSKALDRIESKFLKKPMHRAFRIDMAYLMSASSLERMFSAIEGAAASQGPENVLVILDGVSESDKGSMPWKVASECLWRLSRQGINFAVSVETVEEF